ncbi:MAG: peptidylprolyl isomerase [Deltaproteobacteria bacterium]|nr:peptidylprolyl isomerase [Deltaproteobacteria bacterium]
MFSYLFCAFLLTLGLTALRPSSAEAQAKKDSASSSQRSVVIFQTTEGNFTAELYDDLAPITTGNFLKLIKEKFYDGVIFHRVIDGFMIQGGDPTGTGSGGPGYSINDEFGPGLSHEGEGVLSMANAGPNTGGSQFFITLSPVQYLDGLHSIFGRVNSGMDVVKKIGKVETNSQNKPLKEVKIIKLSIQEPAK